MRAPAKRKRRRPRPSLPKRPSLGWWGDGPSPLDRWPGTTIAFDAVWNPKRTYLTEAGAPIAGAWETHDGEFYFDVDAAARACEFFPTFLTHHIGEFAGAAFEPMDYQRLLLTMPIFGWKQSSDGRRRFRKLFAFLPKGAGKSPWGAGTGIYLTLCDNEPAAEVYAVASDKMQARVVHDNARIMVEQSADLSEMCEVLRDSIFCESSLSLYKVLSSDATTKHGFRPHGVIFDELHGQKDRKLFEALSRSFVKRRQPLMVIITHAGEDDEGICYEEYEYAKRVLSGTIPDMSVLPVIFEATADDDPFSADTWRKVNPGHGITVQHDAIARAALEAQAEPRKLPDFQRFTLNRWVGQAEAWITTDAWDQCRGSVDDAALQEMQLYAGLDMSQKNDLTALVLTFCSPIEGPTPSLVVVGTDDNNEPVTRAISLNFRITVVPFFWIPLDTMKRHEAKDRVPYSLWYEQGLIRATEGNVIDYDRILSDITGEISERFPHLQGAEIGYDPAFATDLALKLNGAGYRMIEVLQNYKHLSEACYVLEALIPGGRVTHDGHRVLRAHFENAAVRRDDAGRIRPVKPRRASKRIDGVVGAVMGVSRMIVAPSTDNAWRPL